MKWKAPRITMIGDIRIVKKFAWWPTRIDHDTTMVWLSCYNALQKYKSRRIFIDEYTSDQFVISWETLKKFSIPENVQNIVEGEEP